ncbi:MAG: RNA polymerase sigma factor RpoH [Pseudomonadota bacterium]|nr:RNA polymerase sigma factor RpoH [Pseudomonadota bacterium]
MTKALVQAQSTLLAPVGNLDAYIVAANRLPVLSAEEERALGIRYRDHNDLDAARTLVTHHLRFVVHVARGYAGYGLALADLIQEGNVGLMKAVKRFNPDLNVRLVSFAVHWIRAEIHEFVLRNWRIVKVATTKAQRKLFFNLRSRKKRLGWLNREEVDAVASDLGVSAGEVMEMERRLGGRDVSYDPEPGEERESSLAPASYIEDQRYDPGEVYENADLLAYQERRLRESLDTLDERSRDILARRWLGEKKETLESLAKRYSVSAERIRQLEKAAIGKLRVDLAT